MINILTRRWLLQKCITFCNFFCFQNTHDMIQLVSEWCNITYLCSWEMEKWFTALYDILNNRPHRLLDPKVMFLHFWLENHTLCMVCKISSFSYIIWIKHLSRRLLGQTAKSEKFHNRKTMSRYVKLTEAKNRSGLWPTGVLGFMIPNDNNNSLELDLLQKLPNYFWE